MGSDDLERLARRWAGEAARLLGVDAPDDLELRVHAEVGISHVHGATVHLYSTPGGAPDVDRLPHELIHVVAGPSTDRFLSEGLAVHAATRLAPGRPCWPCFHLAPDAWVGELRRRGEVPHLGDLVAEARSLRLGTANPADAWLLYVVAGSFTGFLFDTLPRPTFWARYHAPRWDEGTELAELESAWRINLDREPWRDHHAAVVRALDEVRAVMGRAP